MKRKEYNERYLAQRHPISKPDSILQNVSVSSRQRLPIEKSQEVGHESEMDRRCQKDVSMRGPTSLLSCLHIEGIQRVEVYKVYVPVNPVKIADVVSSIM